MKSLLFLAVLTTLTSCGNSDKKDSADAIIEKYSVNAKIHLGMVTQTITKGSGYDLFVDRASQRLKVGTVEVHNLEKSIIIHIDGDKVYTYKEMKDLFTNSVEKSVTMERESDLSIDEGLRTLLGYKNTKVVNDTMTFDYESKPESDESTEQVETAIVTRTIGRVNLLKPLCDSQQKISQSGHLIFNGVTDQLQPISSERVETCEADMTASDIQKLDLKSIEFCDGYDDKEDIDCKQEQDLSFLTKAL